MRTIYLSIKQRETGLQIKKLMEEENYSVKDIQMACGFENPQAVYKWISGKAVPNLEHLLILSKLFHTKIENILVVDDVTKMSEKGDSK